MIFLITYLIILSQMCSCLTKCKLKFCNHSSSLSTTYYIPQCLPSNYTQSSDSLLPRAITPRTILARYLAGTPSELLRFDYSFGVHAALSSPYLPSEAVWLQRAADLIIGHAKRDEDHPHLPLIGIPLSISRDTAHGWDPPPYRQPRVNVNYVLTEAIHCADHGIRNATLKYITGPMRDSGSYHTCHGLWALFIAFNQGCLSTSHYKSLIRPLIHEIKIALARDGHPPLSASPNILKKLDIWAERIMVLGLAQGGIQQHLINHVSWRVPFLVSQPYSFLSLHAASLLLMVLSI